MAIRFLDKEYGSTSTTAIANDSTGTAKIKNLPNAAGIAYDQVDGRIKFNDAGTIRGLGITFNPGVVDVTGSSVTISASTHAGNKPILLDRSGGVAVTLPAATGTGNRYRFVVVTASNATVVSCGSGDSFIGGYIQNDTGDTVPATADFMPAAAGNNTYSPTTVGGGGSVGDWFELIDVQTNIWLFSGVNTTATDPTNRFSTV